MVAGGARGAAEGAHLGAAARLLDEPPVAGEPADGEPMGAVAAGDAQFRLFEAVAACLRDCPTVGS